MPPFNNSLLSKEGTFSNYELCQGGEDLVKVRKIIKNKNSDAKNVLPCKGFVDYGDFQYFKTCLKKSADAPFSTSQEKSEVDANFKSRKTLKKKTSFSTLEIKEYNIIVGDNPGGPDSTGTPISICWEFDEDNVQLHDVDTFEKFRPPRRSGNNLYLSPRERFVKLLQHGCTVDEMVLAANEAKITRDNRSRTNSLNSRATIPVQQAIRCTQKKLKRVFKYGHLKGK